MHTAKSPAKKRQAKLTQLIQSEGYETLEAFLEDNALDSVVPGICLTERCDYTSRPAALHIA